MLDLEYFRKKLEAERANLEADLAKVGRRNPERRDDWEVAPTEEHDTEFRDEIADQLEDFDEREETERELEQRLKSVKIALDKIDRGQYGLCEVGGEAISPERLEANPAARTCQKHFDQEDQRH